MKRFKPGEAHNIDLRIFPYLLCLVIIPFYIPVVSIVSLSLHPPHGHTYNLNNPLHDPHFWPVSLNIPLSVLLIRT